MKTTVFIKGLVVGLAFLCLAASQAIPGARAAQSMAVPSLFPEPASPPTAGPTPNVTPTSVVTDQEIVDKYFSKAFVKTDRQGQVIELRWGGADLTSLPPEIGQLTHLTALYWEYSQITSLPPEIGRLTYLTELHLAGNALTSLPPEIGQLRRLTVLDLGNNRLIYLPPEIGQLASLTKLSLYRNQLASLPAEIGQLTQLTKLDATDNRLAVLPPEIKRLPRLASLKIRGNHLSIQTPAPTPTRLPGSPAPTPFPPLSGRIAFLSIPKDKWPRLYTITIECTGALNECRSYSAPLADGVDDLRAPSWSPDGKHIVFARNRWTRPPGQIYAIDADGSQQTPLIQNFDLAHQPVWSSKNDIVAFFGSRNDPRDSNNKGKGHGVNVVRPDGSGLIATLMETNASVSSFAWSPDGTRLAFEHLIVRGGWLTMFVVEADNETIAQIQSGTRPNARTLLSIPWGRSPAWSPDGKHIAFVCGDVDLGTDICVVNADGSGEANLTQHAGDDAKPIWSPDGTRLAFESTRDGDSEIYVMNADGSGQTNLTNHPADDTNPVWSPDGTRIAFQSTRDDPDFWRYFSCKHDIYIMNADGSEQTRLTNSPADNIYPAWSPK